MLVLAAVWGVRKVQALQRQRRARPASADIVAPAPPHPPAGRLPEWADLPNLSMRVLPQTGDSYTPIGAFVPGSKGFCGKVSSLASPTLWPSLGMRCHPAAPALSLRAGRLARSCRVTPCLQQRQPPCHFPLTDA